MFCSKCGEILPDNAKFCTACGAKVEKHSTVVNNKPQFEHHQPAGQMTLPEAVASFFTNYANFQGRARRAEFWWVVLLNALVQGAVGMILPDRAADAVLRLWQLATLVPSLALNVRRLHDVGKSWTYVLWNLCPVVGQILVLVQMLKEGDHGDNAYGPDPKLCC